VRERVRVVLAAVGVALLATGAGVGAWLGTHPPHPAPDQAAEAFADGRVALKLAVTPEDYRAAYDPFTRAIELRPTFALAFVNRSEAAFYTGAARTTGFSSHTTPEALAASIADLEEALDLGLETRLVFGNLGFYRFLQGLQTSDPSVLEEAVDYTAAAVELDPTDPILRYNYAAALLAEGRIEEARAAYREGVLHAVYSDVERRVKRESGLDIQAASGALTDLELIRAAQPDLADVILELKQYVVASTTLQEPTAPPGTSPPASEVQVRPFPAQLVWESPLEGYDSAEHLAWVQWYRREPTGWAGISEVSGVTPIGGSAGAYFGNDYVIQRTFPPECVRDGEYRVEVYLDGHLVAEGEAGATFGEQEATVLRDLNVVLCGPPEWEPREVVAGVVEGAVAPGGDEGMYALRLESAPEITQGWNAARARAVVEALLETYADQFPGRPVFSEDVGDDFFMGLEGPEEFYFRYQGGLVYAGVGLAEDGSVIVGAVFGPDERFDDGLLQVVDSLNLFEAL
jgi:hypothetical protein